MGKIEGLLSEEMPREKLEKFGAEVLTTVELLAIILRTGTFEKNVLELSREVLEKFGNGDLRFSFGELCKFKGIGKVKACQIASVFELSRRLGKEKSEKKVKVSSSREIFDEIFLDFLNLKKERAMVVLTDSKNQIVKRLWLSEGSLDACIIDPKEVLKIVLDYGVAGFFLAHNHPSGDSRPSAEDIELTSKLKSACDFMCVRFLDHVVVGDNYFSFYESGLL